MRANYKFHAIAISAIAAVIIVVFFLFGQKTQPSAPAKLTPADSYARIVSATWGKNCNTFIESTLAVQAKEGLKKDKNGNVIPTPTLTKVAPNNAIDAVKTLCEGKPYCETRIDSDILKNEPYADCFKRLEVSYRCFNVDRLHTATISQGDMLTIDCTNPMASTASHETSAGQ